MSEVSEQKVRVNCKKEDERKKKPKQKVTESSERDEVKEEKRECGY